MFHFVRTMGTRCTQMNQRANTWDPKDKDHAKAVSGISRRKPQEKQSKNRADYLISEENPSSPICCDHPWLFQSDRRQLHVRFFDIESSCFLGVVPPAPVPRPLLVVGRTHAVNAHRARCAARVRLRHIAPHAEAPDGPIHGKGAHRSESPRFWSKRGPRAGRAWPARRLAQTSLDQPRKTAASSTVDSPYPHSLLSQCGRLAAAALPRMPRDHRQERPTVAQCASTPATPASVTGTTVPDFRRHAEHPADEPCPTITQTAGTHPRQPAGVGGPPPQHPPPTTTLRRPAGSSWPSGRLLRRERISCTGSGSGRGHPRRQ